MKNINELSLPLKEKNIKVIKELMSLMKIYIDNSNNDFSHKYPLDIKRKLLTTNKKILTLIIIYTPIEIKTLHQELWKKMTENCARLIRKSEFDTMFTKTRNCFEKHFDILNIALTECMENYVKESLQKSASKTNEKIKLETKKLKSTGKRKKKNNKSDVINKLSGDIMKSKQLEQSMMMRKTDVKPQNAITTKSSIWTVRKK
jgi:hypothetical protein